MYRNQIGTNKDYSFGVELEFTNADLEKVSDWLEKEDIPFLYQLQHKTHHPDYQVWYLDVDPTVTELREDHYIGGELSSRIFSDDFDSWEELQKVCQILRKMKACSSDKSSTHITVDISKYKNNPVFFETLSRVISVYENDMNFFFMGDYFLKRKTKDDYAANMDFRLRRNLAKVDFSHEKFLDHLIFQTECFRLRDGVSFFKLYSDGLMEVRYPNGTLQEETIQTNINFVLKLLKAIEEGKFDLSYLTEQMEKDRQSPDEMMYYFRSMERPERFMELISYLGSSLDQEQFSKQYQKVLASKP